MTVQFSIYAKLEKVVLLFDHKYVFNITTLPYQTLALNVIVVGYLGCIGCPDWNRCCARDVFGSCVECPSWNKCCYKTGDPVCVAKNHGCDHIRKVASGNLEDARVS